MLRVIGNDQNLPRQEHAVASGTLPNGKPVIAIAMEDQETAQDALKSYNLTVLSQDDFLR